MAIIDSQVERITGTINLMINRFQDIFSGHQFLRMHAAFQGVSQDNFMENYNQSFSLDD